VSLIEYLFKYRGYLPVLFFIAGVLWASPRTDLVIFGAILMAFGELIRFIAVSYLGSTTRSGQIASDELVTNGPYAYLRNPIYLGNIFIYMGASILSGAWLPYLLYLVIIFFAIIYHLFIRYEESALSSRYSAKYEDYKNYVPSIFPRLSAYHNRGDKKPDLSVALSAERLTFLSELAFVLLVMIHWYFIS
jgi:protein-S-isoprenylcysteine O-methyltransferase Ste14